MTDFPEINLKITIYDNKITAADTSKNAEGYLLNVTLDAKKMYADSTGKEAPGTADNYIEVGVYKDKKTLSLLKMYKLKQGENRLVIQLKEKPYKVVIDPRMLLIDKKPTDNEMKAGAKAEVVAKK